jgi:hypothetical protein
VTQNHNSSSNHNAALACKPLQQIARHLDRQVNRHHSPPSQRERVLRSCSIILLAIPLAFLPQIHLLYAAPTTSGTSSYYLLSNEILCTSQLSMAIWRAPDQIGSFFDPNTRRISGQATGWKFFGALLGILQLATLWLCSSLQ